MRRVRMRVIAADLGPDDSYQRISDFARYPELTDAVRKVVVHPPEPDGAMLSEWTVVFRKGLLCWTERDTFDPVARRIRFTQVNGDFATFEGSWIVEESPNGSLVVFDAGFDLGIPTLAELLDPVADSTLRSNILLILRGLLGSVELLESDSVDAVEVGRD